MKTILIFLVFVYSVSFGQLSRPFYIQIDDSIPNEFKFNVPELSEKLYARIPENTKNGIQEQMSCVFACEAGYQVSRFIYGGNIYYQQNELSDYLNDVLKKVIPDELKNDTSLKVFLHANGSYNAFIFPTGHMFINIGLITEIPDEATLAAIMAHELAHYYLHHALHVYFASETGMMDFGLLGKTDKVLDKYSSKQELSADSLAIRWLRNSDYNIGGMIQCFEIGEMIENNYQNKIEQLLYVKEGDHPSSDIRRGKLLAYYNKFKNDTGAYYLVSEKKFQKFQKDVKPEILHCLLYNFQYTSCIERAFKYHIYEPYNVVYLRYILEAIRRDCYLDATLWNQNFITCNIFENTTMNNTQNRKKMKDNLFVTPNYKLLSIRTEDTEKILAKFYWNGDPKFKTNEEAFNYFYKICQTFNDHESVLTNALSFTQDTIYRNIFLKKYLAFDDAKYKEYAKCLLKDSLLESLQPNKLIVLTDFRAQIRYAKETVSIQSCTYNNNSFFCALIDSVAKKRGVNKCLYLPELKNNNLKDYKLFAELQTFSFMPIISKGAKAEIQILGPEYWDIFKRYGINYLEFLNCKVLEDKKWDKKIATFYEGQNTNFINLASEKYHTCSVENYISQVRMVQNKTSQYAFFNGSRSLNSSGILLDQIIEEILTQLDLKDKGLLKYDNYIKEMKNTRY